MKMSKPINKTSKYSKVNLYMIDIMSTYGECGNNDFFSCAGDYKTCTGGFTTCSGTFVDCGGNYTKCK